MRMILSEFLLQFALTYFYSVQGFGLFLFVYKDGIDVALLVKMEDQVLVNHHGLSNSF